MSEGLLKKRIKEVLQESYEDSGKAYFHVDDKQDLLNILDEAKQEFLKDDALLHGYVRGVEIDKWFKKWFGEKKP